MTARSGADGNGQRFREDALDMLAGSEVHSDLPVV